MSRTTLIVLMLASRATALAGQVQTGAARADSVVVVPGAGYAAGSFSRFLFGHHYRDMWTTPLTVPVLSLTGFAGGLRPLARGGSMQTRSLRFAATDGRQFVFRSVDKDPSRSLPPELRATFASYVARDLISAEHPGAGVVVARLLDAVGVLHATPQAVVMPDDERLGEFRAEFAGMLGQIEERPIGESDDANGVGFAGATRVEGSEKLLERVTEHSDEQVDAPAFLAARLFDIFVGDWDRHADQWRWARFGDTRGDRWQPIPRDRDWALVKLDGLVWSTARVVYPFPQFVKFQHEYPDMTWLTWNGRQLDRRFLSELERPVWDSVAAAMQGKLSDKVIDDAIRQLPPELAAASTTELRSRLLRRRDNLGQASDRFYRLLAQEVDVHTTDDGELVELVASGDRYLDVTVRQRTRAGAPRARIWFRRRFDANETREIRLYLHGGDDQVVVRGDGTGRILTRVIGGGGANRFVDSTGTRSANVRYYDTNAASGLDNSDASIDRRTYVPPPTRRGAIDPPRDWGSRWRPLPWVSYTPAIGPFIGGGPLYKRYGFRQALHAYEMSLRVGYAPVVDKWRVEYAADVRRSNSNVHGTLLARMSGLDIVHFYGFGNETEAVGSTRSHRVDQQVFAVEPTLHLPIARYTTFDLGLRARRTSTTLDSAGRASAAPPYGAGNIGQFGLRGGLTFDSRDTAVNAKRGMSLSITAADNPGFGGQHHVGEIRSQATTYLGASGRLQPVLALRAGADRVWGRYPFFDAAFVGGSESVRGWNENRFAGDGSVYGNAELRVFLTRFFFLLPVDLGAFALADGGRVFQPGESSDAWHTGVGGGLWVSLLGRGNTFSLTAANSREGTKFYFRSGFLY